MSDDLQKKYWEGNGNKMIRYWFYNSRGLDLFNNFRYIVMTIFGIYFAMKLKNPFWLLVMFGISIPALIGIGYIQVHYIGKVMDWLNIKFSTHYGKYTYELMESQLKELKEISNALKKSSNLVD